MEDICFEISSSVSKALPAFVKQQYDTDCSIFLDFIEERWKNAELSSMLTCIDKYLQYTCGENSQPTLELMNILYNKNESELDQVSIFQNKLSLKLKVRSCKLLNSILECCVQLLYSIWENGCKDRAEHFNKILDFVRIEVILKALENYFSPDYAHRMAVSYNKRRSWITSLVRLSSLIRRIWIFRRDIGNFLINYILRYNNQDFSDLESTQNHTNLTFSEHLSDVSSPDEPMSEEFVKELSNIEIDVGNCVIFYKIRVILLLCPNSTLYDLLVNGLLFKWWDVVNGDIVPSWHPVFLTFFFRAAKFGWATDQCVCPYFKGKIQTIFNITLNSFLLPNKPKLEKYNEIMPGEYTCLLPKTFKLFKKTAKLLILILHENDLCTSKFRSSLSLNHESDAITSNGVELSDSVREETGEFDESFVDDDPDDIFTSLKRLINILYPYAHPSSSGKWSHSISLFLKYLIVSHSRKLLRHKYINKGLETDASESAEGGDNICDMLYTISLIGIYNKNMKICNNYEIIIRNICYINKEDYLIRVVEYFTESLTECAEHNRLLTSIRVIIQLIPLIVKHMPHIIMNLFYTAISYIALSEPFINIQILLLISLMLEYLFSIKNNLKSLSEDNKISLLTPKDSLGQENAFEGSNEASEVYEELMLQLNEFSIVYVDKVLELYENINEVDLKGMSLMNNVDVSIYILIKSTIINLLSVVDDQTMSVILNKLMKFIDEYSYKLSIIKHVTSILSSISYLKGIGHTTKLMINNVQGLSEDDKRLRFHLNCLISAIRYNFNSNYFSEIVEVITKGLEYKDKHVYKLVVKLIYRLNQSIYNVYTTSNLPTKESMNGVVVDNGEACIGWYVPTMAQYEMYKRLVLLLMDSINGKYNGLKDKKQTDDTTDDDILKIITLSKYLVKSIVLFDIEIKDKVFHNNVSQMSQDVSENGMEVDSEDRMIFDYNKVVKCLNGRVGDNFTLRGLVERYIMGVVSKIYKKVDGSVVSEKLTKFINFLASKNYFSTDISNNYDFIFNLKLQNNVSITTTKPMLKYISFHCGLTKNSYLMDINFSSYMTIVQDYYYNFINLRKINYNMLRNRVGLKQLDKADEVTNLDDKLEVKKLNNAEVKGLVDLVVVKMCELNYKNVVNNSIMILKSVTMIHKNMKYYVLSSVLKELVASADDNFTLFHNILPLFDANTLTYISLNFTLLELFLWFFLKVISTNNDSLINKYDVLFILFLNQRELDTTSDRIGRVDSIEQTYFEDSENVDMENIDTHDTPCTVKIDKLLSVLRSLMSVVDVENWRFNLYFCTLLLIYSRYVVYENKFFFHVLSLLNDVNNNYLQSVAFQYILITLMSLNSGRVADPVIKKKLLDLGVMGRIFNGLVYCNHDVNTLSSNNLSSIVMNVIKFDKSWPRNRIPSNSTILSKYNFFLSYHYFKFLMINSQTPEKHVESLEAILQNLIQISSDYIEYHLSLMEIMGGVLKCVLELWSRCGNLFPKFMSFLSKHLSEIKLEYMVHYMDAMRLVLQGKNDFQPLINFLLHCNVNHMDTVGAASDNGALCDEIKQLKLFQVLLQENIKIDEQVLSKKMELLLKDIGVKSFKIRNEIYTIVAYVRGFYGMKLEVPDDPVFVTTYYKMNLYNLDVEGISGHINTIQNEKLTNDIYNVISHVPRDKIHCVVKQLVRNIDNKRLKLLDMIFFDNVFYIVNTKTIRLLFNSYINKLNAKSNLTNVISSLNDETLNRIIGKIDKSLNNIDVIICIVNSIKYNIPKWLPTLLLSLVTFNYPPIQS
uniref:Proteasome activator Blm10 middle HEAT repeats region domain-containing protein n=1 Tax=Theileria parva TaxID=5875 RepID=Q4N1Y2_THEPA|eukprot:XP_764230.1 hypothetical protein [Theileria parva strain Muguga]